MEFTNSDPLPALRALDGFAWLLMAGAAFCTWPSPTAEASQQLERLLLAVILNAATLVLWNALDGLAAAWTQWCTALLPSLLVCRLLRAASGLRFRSEEHTSELQSLMRISYAVFCLKKKKNTI